MVKTIMIVDDAVSIRGLASMTLENSGYRVIEAHDGKDALEKLSGEKVNMIITDLNMPNMDGIEFIKAVRVNETYKMIPILFLTTESQNEKKMEAKEAGATGWIIKPFLPAKLIAAIQKVMI